MKTCLVGQARKRFRGVERAVGSDLSVFGGERLVGLPVL
jgi:hypothetical protein